MLKGKYIGLRAVEEEDLLQLMTWRNDPALRKYFRETNEINKVNQENWFKSVISKDSFNKMFSIVKLDTNELVGACGLCHIDWINRSADFSIYIGYKNKYIDNKMARDAAYLMIKYGYDVLNLHRFWTEIYSLDYKKKNFYDSLGFNFDGCLRQTYWFEGKWYDSYFYSLLRTDGKY